MPNRRIAHISDLHFGEEDPPVAEGLIHSLHEINPDLIIVSGDLTQRATHTQYRQAAEWLKRIPEPQLIVPGNHDIPLFNLWKRFVHPLKGYKTWISDDPDPSYIDDSIAVKGLNTARSLTWKNGRISRQQIEMARSFFADAGAQRHRILVTHHIFAPPPEFPGKRRVGRGGLALKKLHEESPDIVLAGHLHRHYHADIQTWEPSLPRSVLTIQAGTAISVRRRTDANTWNLMELEPDALRLHVMSWTGTRFEAISETVWSKKDTIWIPVKS